MRPIATLRSMPFTGLSRGRENVSATKTARSWLIDGLQIIALFDIVVAQPILARDARHGWYLVSERAGALDFALRLGLLCLLFPATIVAIEALVGLVNRRARNLTHMLVMTVLFFLLADEVIQHVRQVSALKLFLLSFAVAAVLGLLYSSFMTARSFVTYLSIATLVVPGNFLFRTQISELVLPSSSPVAATVSASNPVPVVMLVFDEFPLVSLLDDQHQISSNLFPNFAQLAADAYWFRNATTVSDYTYQAVPAIMTGMYPNPPSLPTVQDHPDNIFTLLGNDYDEHVVEPITHLCPPSICDEASPSLATRVRITINNLFGVDEPPSVTDPNRTDTFQGFVQSIEPSARPALYFDHIVTPHAPWERLPDGKIYTDDGTVTGLNSEDTWTNDQWLIEQSYQRHLLQAEYADTLLGQLIDHLKAVGMYDKALVVVVADHGETFTSGEQRRTFDPAASPEIMPVPLLVKLPHQAASVTSDENAQTIDVLPTIADVLGVSIPWNVDGHSVLDDSTPRSQKLLINTVGKHYVFGSTIDGIDATVAYKESLFGNDPTPDDLFKIGPYPSLFGSQSDEVSDIDQDVAYTFDQDDELDDVDLSSNFVPALISGRVFGAGDSGDQYLAIAVNGTVQAVTQTYSDDSQTKFTAMIPETSLNSGKNTVEVFTVSGSQTSPTLTRLARKS